MELCPSDEKYTAAILCPGKVKAHHVQRAYLCANIVTLVFVAPLKD